MNFKWMNHFFLFVAVIFLSVTISCDNTKPAKEEVEALLQNPTDTLSIPKLTGVKPALTLTPEAAEAVQGWRFYTQLSQAIDSLSGTTMGELKPRIQRLEAIFEEKEVASEAEAPTTPEKVKTKAIESRIRAIETQLGQLRTNTARTTPDMQQVAVAMVKVKNGLQHLNLQLNERFSISIQELLDEIKEEKDDTDLVPVNSSSLPPTLNN